MTTSDAFARQWVDAWNRRDLEALLSHYADDIEFRSLLVARLLGDASGSVRGKQNLRAYFEKALAAFPGDLNIEFLGVFTGVDSVVVLFEAKGFKAAEWMQMDTDGLIRRAAAHVAQS